MKRRVKADRLTPGLPVIGCAYPKTDGRRGSEFRVSDCPSTAASPSQAKLCPFGSQNPPSDVHQVSRRSKRRGSEISSFRLRVTNGSRFSLIAKISRWLRNVQMGPALRKLIDISEHCRSGPVALRASLGQLLQFRPLAARSPRRIPRFDLPCSGPPSRYRLHATVALARLSGDPCEMEYAIAIGQQINPTMYPRHAP
jgi:hypothetical protein